MKRKFVTLALVTIVGLGGIGVAAKPVDVNAPSYQCLDSHLKVTVQQDPEAAGAGQRRAFVVIQKVIGAHACHLRGYPGVSFFDNSTGSQVGQALPRTGPGKVVTLRLALHEYAVAPINYTYVDKQSGNIDADACQPLHAEGYRVYPPHSFTPVFTRYSTYACTGKAHWISLGTMTKTKQPGFKPVLKK